MDHKSKRYHYGDSEDSYCRDSSKPNPYDGLVQHQIEESMEINFSDNKVKCKGGVPSVYTLWGEVPNP